MKEHWFPEEIIWYVLPDPYQTALEEQQLAVAPEEPQGAVMEREQPVNPWLKSTESNLQTRNKTIYCKELDEVE